MVTFPPTNSNSRLYSVSEIAASLGKDRKTIRQALAGFPPIATGLRGGNEAQLWGMPDMAPGLRAAFTKAPTVAWQSPFPLADVHPRCVEQAAKLRAAFEQTFAARWRDKSLSSELLAEQGVEDYRGVFGHVICAGHWQRLLSRITARDSGAENFDRLEIYLPERIYGKPAAAGGQDADGDFWALAAEAEAWLTGGREPSLAERRFFDTAACEWLVAHCTT